MLRIPNLEELQALLLRLPRLVDGIEERNPAAVDHIREWLRSLETALGNNRMPLAAEIAGLRVQLAMGTRGVLVEGLTVSGRLTLRKVREVTASEVLRHAGTLLSGAIAGDVARVDEADRVARQLTTVAQIKGLIPAAPPRADHLGAVRAIWGKVESDVDIGQGAVHILSLLGPEDAVIALDRAISRDIWK